MGIMKDIWFLIGNMWVIAGIIAVMGILIRIYIEGIVIIYEPSLEILMIEMVGMLIALIYTLSKINKRCE